MKDHSRRVYILILNYRNWQDTVECLDSVFRLQYDDFCAVVIDNASGNDSLRHLMDWADQPSNAGRTGLYRYFTRPDLVGAPAPSDWGKLVFIQNDSNNGFAGGNNVALSLLTGEEAWIWLLNPDMTVEPDALTQLVFAAEAAPRRTIMGPVVRYHEQPDKIHFYGGSRILFSTATVSLITRPEDVDQLDYISGGALFTRAASFRELGLLPEAYFLYWEETDWCYRAGQRGYGMKVCLSAICYDKIGTTIGRGTLAEYYYTRNGLLFLSAHRPAKVPVAVLFTGVRIVKKLLMGQMRRALGVWKGTRDFLKRRSYETK